MKKFCISAFRRLSLKFQWITETKQPSEMWLMYPTVDKQNESESHTQIHKYTFTLYNLAGA